MQAGLPHGTYAPGLAVRLILFLSGNTVLGRGKARKMMAALVRRFSGDMLDVSLFDQKVRLHLHNNSSEIKALMNPRRFARAERKFCAAHLPSEDGVFVDIGANAGLFSLGVLGHMKRGTLIAAEPQPALHARLTANLQSFNPDRPDLPVMHILETAIGATEGELTLSVPDQLGQASIRGLADAKSMTVPVRPLKDIVLEMKLDRIDVLKIDVEGFEDEVLIPFLETVPKALWPRGIVLEHCHRDRWERDCEAALLDAGYVLVYQDRTNLLLEQRTT